MDALSGMGCYGISSIPFYRHPFKENHMPIIAWLLGVPISVILILMLFGVF